MFTKSKVSIPPISIRTSSGPTASSSAGRRKNSLSKKLLLGRRPPQTPRRQSKPRLQIEISLLQAHRIAVRIDESLDAAVEAGELLRHPAADLVESRRIVDPPSLAEDGHQQILARGVRRNHLAPRHVQGIDHDRHDGREWQS